MGEPLKFELLGIGRTIDLGVVVTALPERDRERVVEGQGASGPRAWTGADRSDLVELGGRPVAIGMPATYRASLIGVGRAEVPAAAVLGLRPHDAPRRRTTGRTEPVRRRPQAPESGPQHSKDQVAIRRRRLIDQNPLTD